MADNRKVIVSTECVADLPEEYLQRFKVPEILHYMKVGDYIYQNVTEISSANVVEYMMKHNDVPVPEPPTKEDYEVYFDELLKQGMPIIHVVMTGTMSASYNTLQDIIKTRPQVSVVDCRQLSGAMGLMTLDMAQMALDGCTREEILAKVPEIIKRQHTSFIVESMEYLYRNHYVSRQVQRVCDTFGVRPVLKLINGYLKVGGIKLSSQKKARASYIKQMIKKEKNIDGRLAFVVYVGLSVKEQQEVREEIDSYGIFERVEFVPACATIACCCGNGTFGILFQDK